MDNPTKGDSVLEEIIFALGVFAFGLSALYLISIFRAQILRGWKRGMAKLWGVGAPERVLAKRIKLFILFGVLFVAVSKLLYLGGVTFPNFELIIPTLVVVGCFSLPVGSRGSWRFLTRYFGVIALASVFFIDICFWGFKSIYVFTWSGFIICWLLGMRNKLSMFGRFTRLLYRTTLTAAVAIIAFDIYTAFGWAMLTGAGLTAVFIAQLPFTLYHLSSLVFVPPLVGLAKAMVKVKVQVPVAVSVKHGVGVQERS